jgi:hypothetical protein
MSEAYFAALPAAVLVAGNQINNGNIKGSIDNFSILLKCLARIELLEALLKRRLGEIQYQQQLQSIKFDKRDSDDKTFWTIMGGTTLIGGSLYYYFNYYGKDKDIDTKK